MFHKTLPRSVILVIQVYWIYVMCYEIGVTSYYIKDAID